MNLKYVLSFSPKDVNLQGVDFCIPTLLYYFCSRYE